MGDAQRRLRRSLSSVDRPSIDRHNRIEIHRLADLVDEARSVPGGAKRRLQDLSLLRRTAWLLRCLVDQTLDSDLLGRLPMQSNQAVIDPVRPIVFRKVRKSCHADFECPNVVAAPALLVDVFLIVGMVFSLCRQRYTILGWRQALCSIPHRYL